MKRSTENRKSKKVNRSEFILNKKSRKQKIKKRYVKIDNPSTIDKYMKKQIGKGMGRKKINRDIAAYQFNGIKHLSYVMKGGEDNEEQEPVKKKGQENYAFTKAQIVGFWLAYRTRQIPKKQYIAFKYMRKSAYYIDRLRREMAIWGKYAIRLIEDEGKHVGKIKKVHHNIDELFKTYRNIYEKKGGRGLIKSQKKLEKYKKRIIEDIFYKGTNLRKEEVKGIKNKFKAMEISANSTISPRSASGYEFISYSVGDKKVSYEFNRDTGDVLTVNIDGTTYRPGDCIKVTYASGKYHYKIHSFEQKPKNILIKCFGYDTSKKEFETDEKNIKKLNVNDIIDKTSKLDDCTDIAPDNSTIKIKLYEHDGFEIEYFVDGKNENISSIVFDRDGTIIELAKDKIIKYRTNKGMTEFHKIDSFKKVSVMMGDKAKDIKIITNICDIKTDPITCIGDRKEINLNNILKTVISMDDVDKIKKSETIFFEVDGIKYKAEYEIDFSDNKITNIVVKNNSSDSLFMTLDLNTCIETKTATPKNPEKQQYQITEMIKKKGKGILIKGILKDIGDRIKMEKELSEIVKKFNIKKPCEDRIIKKELGTHIHNGINYKITAYVDIGTKIVNKVELEFNDKVLELLPNKEIERQDKTGDIILVKIKKITIKGKDIYLDISFKIPLSGEKNNNISLEKLLKYDISDKGVLSKKAGAPPKRPPPKKTPPQVAPRPKPGGPTPPVSKRPPPVTQRSGEAIIKGIRFSHKKGDESVYIEHQGDKTELKEGVFIEIRKGGTFAELILRVRIDEIEFDHVNYKVNIAYSVYNTIQSKKFSEDVWDEHSKVDIIKLLKAEDDNLQIKTIDEAKAKDPYNNPYDAPTIGGGSITKRIKGEDDTVESWVGQKITSKKRGERSNIYFDKNISRNLYNYRVKEADINYFFIKFKKNFIKFLEMYDLDKSRELHLLVDIDIEKDAIKISDDILDDQKIEQIKRNIQQTTIKNVNKFKLEVMGKKARKEDTKLQDQLTKYFDSVKELIISSNKIVPPIKHMFYSLELAGVNRNIFSLPKVHSHIKKRRLSEHEKRHLKAVMKELTNFLILIDDVSIQYQHNLRELETIIPSKFGGYYKLMSQYYKIYKESDVSSSIQGKFKVYKNKDEFIKNKREFAKNIGKIPIIKYGGRDFKTTSVNYNNIKNLTEKDIENKYKSTHVLCVQNIEGGYKINTLMRIFTPITISKYRKNKYNAIYVNKYKDIKIKFGSNDYIDLKRNIDPINQTEYTQLTYFDSDSTELNVGNEIIEFGSEDEFISRSFCMINVEKVNPNTIPDSDRRMYESRFFNIVCTHFGGEGHEDEYVEEFCKYNIRNLQIGNIIDIMKYTAFNTKNPGNFKDYFRENESIRQSTILLMKVFDKMIELGPKYDEIIEYIKTLYDENGHNKDITYVIINRLLGKLVIYDSSAGAGKTGYIAPSGATKVHGEDYLLKVLGGSVSIYPFNGKGIYETFRSRIAAGTVPISGGGKYVVTDEIITDANKLNEDINDPNQKIMVDYLTNPASDTQKNYQMMNLIEYYMNIFIVEYNNYNFPDKVKLNQPIVPIKSYGSLDILCAEFNSIDISPYGDDILGIGKDVYEGNSLRGQRGGNELHKYLIKKQSVLYDKNKDTFTHDEELSKKMINFYVCHRNIMNNFDYLNMHAYQSGDEDMKKTQLKFIKDNQVININNPLEHNIRYNLIKHKGPFSSEKDERTGKDKDDLFKDTHILGEGKTNCVYVKNVYIKVKTKYESSSDPSDRERIARSNFIQLSTIMTGTSSFKENYLVPGPKKQKLNKSGDANDFFKENFSKYFSYSKYYDHSKEGYYADLQKKYLDKPDDEQYLFIPIYLTTKYHNRIGPINHIELDDKYLFQDKYLFSKPHNLIYATRATRTSGHSGGGNSIKSIEYNDRPNSHLAYLVKEFDKPDKTYLTFAKYNDFEDDLIIAEHKLEQIPDKAIDLEVIESIQIKLNELFQELILLSKKHNVNNIVLNVCVIMNNILSKLATNNLATVNDIDILDVLRNVIIKNQYTLFRNICAIMIRMPNDDDKKFIVKLIHQISLNCDNYDALLSNKFKAMKHSKFEREMSLDLPLESDQEYNTRLDKLLNESLARHTPLELHFVPYQLGGARPLEEGSSRHKGFERNRSVDYKSKIPGFKKDKIRKLFNTTNEFMGQLLNKYKFVIEMEMGLIFYDWFDKEKQLKTVDRFGLLESVEYHKSGIRDGITGKNAEATPDRGIKYKDDEFNMVFMRGISDDSSPYGDHGKPDEGDLYGIQRELFNYIIMPMPSFVESYLYFLTGIDARNHTFNVDMTKSNYDNSIRNPDLSQKHIISIVNKAYGLDNANLPAELMDLLLRILLIPEQDLRKIVMYYDSQQNPNGNLNRKESGRTTETFEIFGEPQIAQSSGVLFGYGKHDKIRYSKGKSIGIGTRPDGTADKFYIADNHKHHFKHHKILKIILRLIEDSLIKIDKVIDLGGNMLENMEKIKKLFDDEYDNKSMSNKDKKNLENDSIKVIKMVYLNMRWIYLSNLVEMAKTSNMID